MAERKRQYSTYTDDTLGDRIEAATEDHNMSIAELLRQGAELKLAELEATA